MSQHSLAIIGCGSIGERHLRCFQETGRAKVSACDANAALLQRMAETYAVPTFAGWEDAVASVDTVVICTPAPVHIPIAIRALNAGKHVLIEKPLSTSMSGVGELVRARDRSGRQAAVAYTHRSIPFLQEARAFVLSGKIGPVREAWVATGQPFHLLRPAYAQTYFRSRATGGGALQDALTHAVNWMESVLGPVDSVICDCAHQVLPGIEVEDTVHVSARHGHALASYALNQFQAPNENTIQLNAAGASVKIEYQNQRWGFFREGDADWTWHKAPAANRDTYYISQANAFLDQIEGKTTHLCTLEEGIATLRFNLAAMAAAETGARTRTADFRE